MDSQSVWGAWRLGPPTQLHCTLALGFVIQHHIPYVVCAADTLLLNCLATHFIILWSSILHRQETWPVPSIMP